jgi:hypothetical protein
VTEVDGLAARLLDGGHELTWDDNVPGVRRFHTHDPVGNRVEFQLVASVASTRAALVVAEARAQAAG